MTQHYINKQFEELLPLINERNRADGLQLLNELAEDIERDVSDAFINVIKSAVENATHVPMMFEHIGGLVFSFFFVDEEEKGGIDFDIDYDSPFVVVTVDTGDSETYETHPITELMSLFNKLGAIQKVNERTLNNIKQLLNKQYEPTD